MKLKKSGFTLIELLIVVVILSILSSFGYWQIAGNSQKLKRDSQRIADIDSVKVALEAYYEKNNIYPPADALYANQTTFTSQDPQPWIPEIVPSYIKFLPNDPQEENFDYAYYVSLDRKTYSLWATLENQNDPRIHTNPQTKCKTTPPAEIASAGYNFCGGF